MVRHESFASKSRVNHVCMRLIGDGRSCLCPQVPVKDGERKESQHVILEACLSVMESIATNWRCISVDCCYIT